jgi:hypothetical protein
MDYKDGIFQRETNVHIFVIVEKTESFSFIYGAVSYCNNADEL